MRFVIEVFVVLAVIALGAVGFAYSGWYNVAADEPHWPPVAWLLHTTMHSSVESRAQTVRVPDLDAPGRVEEGGRRFKDACSPCHGKPGADLGPIGEGLRPAPADLTESARHWGPAELFWVVRHGVKFTGMPSFGHRYSDDELWSVIAFVEQLPGMSETRYRELTAGADGPR